MNEGFEAYSPTHSMRVMGPHERARFTPDAWGHLVKLSRSGIINTLELEHIIERALLQVDGRISLGDIRGLLSDSGLDDGEGTENVTVH
jgi:uncharacterized protein Smg (DUF494 family)